MELKKSLKHLPAQPGIYFMKNSLGTVIYVGKAKNLKARVSQYFQKNRDNSPKINEMIGHICSFEYITTDTELEAFLLECRTIRELKPQYNRLLKNYKGYKYIKLSVNEDYPKLSIVTQKDKDKALYFGPFTSEGSVENTIQFIKDYYPIRKCSSGALAKNSSGCLNLHIGTCLGPCRGNVLRDEYGEHIHQIVRFLRGKDHTPIKDLNVKMRSAAENMDYEKAAQYRDQLKGIRHVLNMLRVIKVSQSGRNILAAEKYGEEGCKLFLIKGNKLLHMELLSFSEYNNSLEVKLRDLIKTYFKALKKDREDVLSQEDIDEAKIIYSYLNNKNNGIRSFNIPSSRIDKLNYKKIMEFLFN